MTHIRQAYSQLFSECAQSSILAEIEKKFFKIESQFKKCRAFCKNYLAKCEPDNLGRTYFALTPTLIYLLDEQAFALYASVFMAKKIHTVRTVVERCANYHAEFFADDTVESRVEAFSVESFFLPIMTFVSEFVQQMLSGVPTVLIGSLLDAFKNEPLVTAASFTIASHNEHLAALMSHKLATNQINEVAFNDLNQLVIAYDRIWSEIDLLQRIDWSLSFKNRCLKSFKVFNLQIKAFNRILFVNKFIYLIRCNMKIVIKVYLCEIVIEEPNGKF